MGIDRRLLVNVDWVLLGVTLLLTGLGVLTILSAAHSGHGSGLYLKQLYLVGLGLPCLLIPLAVHCRRLAVRAVPLYRLAVGAAVFVLFFGPRIAAPRRWISLGSFHGSLQLQPSELVKLVAALFVAKVFAESRSETLGIRDVLGPGAAVGLLALLIAAEPDLGTAFCLIPLFLSVAFLAGLRMKAVLALFVVLLMVGGLGWQFALKDYQTTRIYTFLDRSLGPRGAGYQRIRSQIGVGSGGLLGKGYKQGSQAQLGYLPARHTDFVFSVLAEEMGFVGVFTVLALYLLLLWRMLETAQLAPDPGGAFLAARIAATFAFHVVYNVSMWAGVFPPQGS